MHSKPHAKQTEISGAEPHRGHHATVAIKHSAAAAGLHGTLHTLKQHYALAPYEMLLETEGLSEPGSGVCSYWEVVAHKVPDAAIRGSPRRRACIKLDGEAAGVPHPLGATHGCAHNGEPHDDICPLANAGEQVCIREVCDIVRDLCSSNSAL